ncbi:MAG: hypothetical protein ACK4PI_12500 [Tepidisphaerales bacterium]
MAHDPARPHDESQPSRPGDGADGPLGYAAPPTGRRPLLLRLLTLMAAGGVLLIALALALRLVSPANPPAPAQPPPARPSTDVTQLPQQP